MVADVAYLEQSLQRSQQQLSQLESSFARQRQAFKANPMPSASSGSTYCAICSAMSVTR